MPKIKILITRQLEKQLLNQIMSVNSDIAILDASSCFDPKQNTEDPDARGKLDTLLAQAEVIVGLWPPRNVSSRAPNLKWFHSLTAGVDHPAYNQIVQKPILVTNSTGIHVVQMGELVFDLALMLAKQATFCFKMQQEKKWYSFRPLLLHGKTLGIVGLGKIGKEVARLGKAFNMKVVATRRSIKQVTRARNVDLLMPSDHLLQLLSQSDYVVLILPATPETKNIIGEKELRSMKPTAFLINVARGAVVDEEALIRALEERWIAGAGLDTVAFEPLPPDSKLWELPNVIITPHIGGRREDYNNLAIPLFCENLKRYISGKKLLNVVRWERGY